MATARGHGEICTALLQHEVFAGTSFVDHFGRTVHAMQERSPKDRVRQTASLPRPELQMKPPADGQKWQSLAKWTSQLKKFQGEAGQGVSALCFTAHVWGVSKLRF